MDYFNQILDIQFFGNDLRTYAIALLVIALIFIIFRILLAAFFAILRKVTKRTKTDIDDAIIEMFDRSRWVVFAALALIYVKMTIKLTEMTQEIIIGLFNVIVVFLAIRIANFWIDFFANRIAEKKRLSGEQFSIEILSKAAKILVWVFAVLFLISTFGYNISSLIAGLGIGGIAIALAVQSVLSDLISSVSIYLDKPFKVGDFVVIGNQMGTIKHIGLKTTRVTSLQGEEIVMSNKKLTESDINNFGKLKKRRVVVPLGVTYDTKLKKMKDLPNAFKEIIDSVKDTTFDRAHFRNYGDFSKNFELVFYVDSKDYYTYMDRLEEINLKIQEYFEKEKIDFAFPSQTIYLEK